MNKVKGKTEQRNRVTEGTKMPIQKGDFILINYTSKVKETGEIFDTTNEEIAKKEKFYKEGEI